jgi:ABC-2 type transport system permease protein
VTAAAAWVASDYWEMTKRSLRHIRHDPEQLLNVTLQPVLIVVLMDLLFGGAIKTVTHGSYVNFVMPGIFVVAAAFAAVTTTISVAADMGEGVIDRFRTLPMAKSAVITGHVVADLARSLVGLAVAIAAGYAAGFRPAAGPAGWAAAVAVFLLVTLALSLLAALIGLLGRSVEVPAPRQPPPPHPYRVRRPHRRRLHPRRSPLQPHRACLTGNVTPPW